MKSRTSRTTLALSRPTERMEDIVPAPRNDVPERDTLIYTWGEPAIGRTPTERIPVIR